MVTSYLTGVAGNMTNLEDVMYSTAGVKMMSLLA